ncbi:uroporphyrinogen-III synthase [Diaphorobacter ruginosibacter]|uniref:Uroporphyrinogen-III synthase n=1 Tax=Diaphorobacter ruginosibacter TaxID=1715720 RepID=A0A7G9RSB5_9BURK|nr:uroporphyrinogen-III synthase [Diaphorobacter ruginosibacter]QNN58490.1 uroporphyrinogen-III synthase [Diaphorobacter ruginosibacter]
MPSVLVTRPSSEAERWADQLRAQQIDARVLPLLAISPVRSPQLQAALHDARHRLRQFSAVMFVSGNAASEFLARDVDLGDGGPPCELRGHLPRFWSPGPGTARALEQAGVPAGRIDGPAADSGQFDSESLWLAVAHQVRPGDRVLIVRGASSPAKAGGNGRDWLASRIAAAGAKVEFVAAYERVGAPLDSNAKDLAARAASDGSLWFFSSSEAIRHLEQQMPQMSWDKARALVTHPRIAQAARAAGFGRVSECRPTLQDVVASIKSMP